MPAEELLRARRTCYDNVYASAAASVYYTRPADSNALRAKAYALAAVPSARAP